MWTSDEPNVGGIVRRRERPRPWMERPGAAQRAQKQRAAEQAKLTRDWEKFKAQVRADIEAETNAKAAEEAELVGLSPEQRIERVLQRRSEAQIPGNYPRRPAGWMIARQEIRTEEREAEQRERQDREQTEQRELEAREKDLGLPKARQRAEREERDADTECDEALAKLNAEHEQACEAVRDRCRVRHETARQTVKALEDRLLRTPTNDDLEQVAV